ncbi:MAG TPA: hypothetical protein VK463_11290 [Desulfomonilaceae bacterium]|nr:hypothetical protein [Desulfomonilaceae bacterium]
MTRNQDIGQYVEFDVQQFFHELLGKLEAAKARDLRPAIKDEPVWMFSVPEEIKDGKITKFFIMMVKETAEELELHYGNSIDTEIFQVTFTGASKTDFVKCVAEITEHVYGETSLMTQ